MNIQCKLYLHKQVIASTAAVAPSVSRLSAVNEQLSRCVLKGNFTCLPPARSGG